ncbi:MAG: MMPL family transporter [bacterium]|nr:MMPL family transporter [bacterium]
MIELIAGPVMSRLLYRMGRWSAAHGKPVLVAWVVVVVLLGVLSRAVGGHVTDQFELPGAESQVAADLLEERFPAVGRSSTMVVVAADDLRAHAGEVSALAAGLDGVAGVVSVGDPRRGMAPSGTVLQFPVRFDKPAEQVEVETWDRVLAVVDAARSPALQVELGGEVANEMARTGPAGTSELIGVAVAVVVLILVFGSFLAMGLTLLTALIGVGVSLATILLVAAAINVPTTAEILALMLGIAVGIDYALFIMSRHRENLVAGMDVPESIGRSLATAGGAVVFAGSTVVIAMLGLIVVGTPSITTMALAVAFAVIVAVVVALTLLPALLGLAGRRLAAPTLPGLRNRRPRARDENLGTRWTTWVARRPWLSFGMALLAMLVMAVPLLDLETAFPSAGSAPEETTHRRAHDLITEGFGPGFNGPLLMVVDHSELPAAGASAAVSEIGSVVRADPNVGFIVPGASNPAGDTTLMQAIPLTGPADAATKDLLERMRGEILPAVESTYGIEVYVTGPTALDIDVTKQLTDRLPWVMTVVIGLIFVVLMLAFRSLLVPLKAAIGILLSIGAALGIVVAVFQWGWGASLLGVDGTMPIISFLPVMSFAILFGLSMDYEVFILSRVREEWLRTGDARESVIKGVGATARVITAAAAIMTAVFAGFLLGDQPVVKMIGLALAVAVLLDATVIRLILVPSTMVMFNRANWWLPGWLDRILPNVDIEGGQLLDESEATG